MSARMQTSQCGNLLVFYTLYVGVSTGKFNQHAGMLLILRREVCNSPAAPGDQPLLFSSSGRNRKKHPRANKGISFRDELLSDCLACRDRFLRFSNGYTGANLQTSRYQVLINFIRQKCPVNTLQIIQHQ